MRVLALDAALDVCSAALIEDGACMAEATAGDSRQAAASLPPLVQSMLARHGSRFDAVAVTTGPGSFTGLRGSIGLAHGLALAAGVPVVGVTAADAMWPGADPAVWVVIDARRAGRVFVARDGAVTVCLLDDPPLPPPGTTLIGNGADALAGALAQRGIIVPVGDTPVLSAAATGQAAWHTLQRGDTPGHVEPLYVDPPQARPASAQRPAPV